MPLDIKPVDYASDIYTPIPYKDQDVGFIDPPWEYDNRVQKGQGSEYDYGAAEKYPSLSVNEIAALDISRVMAKNSLIYIWTPHTHTQIAIELANHWGFKFWGMMPWDKHFRNPGSRFMVHSEFVVIGKRGTEPKPRAINRKRKKRPFKKKYVSQIIRPNPVKSLIEAISKCSERDRDAMWWHIGKALAQPHEQKPRIHKGVIETIKHSLFLEIDVEVEKKTHAKMLANGGLMICDPRTSHSTKTSMVMDDIDVMHPWLNKFEAFARVPRPYWNQWGNEI